MWALVVNIFWPSITHPPSTWRARVCTAATSDPASGSLIPSAIVASPDITFGTISSRSHAEPTALITFATIVDVDTA
jgi:hypothetical protein